MDGLYLNKATAFKYLRGCMTAASGDLDREIQARLQGTGNTWRSINGIIYNERMPMRLRKQVYKTMVSSEERTGGWGWE